MKVNFKSILNKTNMKIKKHSPEILIVTGVIGVITGTVMACKATTKVDDIVNNAKEQLDDIRDSKDENQSEEDKKVYNKELASVYAKYGISIAKLYLPAVAVEIASLGCVLASHNIIKKRNIGIAAAYSALDKGFEEYRDRVVKKYGEDAEKQIRYGITNKKFEETVTDENGKKKKVKKDVDIVDIDQYSPYARFFDEGCKLWEESSEYNLTFLTLQQSIANDKLKSHGYLYLNDVYRMLGIRETKAGQVIGWIYNPKDDTKHNFVDFGIFETHREANRDFVNGYENVILLDFNVDGNIWEQMDY